MNSGRCYVAPSMRQQELLRRHIRQGDVVILARDIFEHGTDGLNAALDSLERSAAGGADVLCMTETGVYLASVAKAPINAGVSRNMIDATTKSKKRELLERAGLPVLPTEQFILGSGDHLPVDPPFVIKPDFSFASQLAMRIANQDDWCCFLAAARDPALWEPRRVHAALFFAADERLLDRFVIQPDLSQATFLTISFAFIDGVATSFIASGEKVVASAATSFAWRGFAAPVTLPNTAVQEIDAELGRMALAVGCRNGVYAAELLRNDAEHWYLEFEPRPQSGLIPDLLLHAFGVDIDELAIDLFHGSPLVLPDLDRTAHPTHFGLRREHTQERTNLGTLAVALDRDSAGTMLCDEVWALPKGVE